MQPLFSGVNVNPISHPTNPYPDTTNTPPSRPLTPSHKTPCAMLLSLQRVINDSYNNDIP
jgi:hypothetical protein